MADASREIINIASSKATKPIIPDVSYKGIKKMLKDVAKEWREAEENDIEQQLINELRQALSQFNLIDKAVEKVDSVFSELDKGIKKITEEKDRKAMERKVQAALLEAPFIGELLDTTSDALFFIGRQEAIDIAVLAVDYIKNGIRPDKKQVQEALNYYKDCGAMRSYAVDIALFGRMVAKAPSLNADASVQVAHAISTHKVENEYDYFTAMDDRAPEDQTGAGMIGTIEFNSSTLYRYATVAAHDLKDNLGDSNATAKAVKEFIRAFICSMPTGKLNTFANNTPPYAVMVAIRRDQPINLVGAFETPIKAGEGGYQEKSAKAMANYVGSVLGNFFKEPEKVFITAIGNELNGLGDSLELPELLEKTEQVVGGLLHEDGMLE